MSSGVAATCRDWSLDFPAPLTRRRVKACRPAGPLSLHSNDFFPFLHLFVVVVSLFKLVSRLVISSMGSAPPGSHLIRY